MAVRKNEKKTPAADTSAEVITDEVKLNLPEGVSTELVAEEPERVEEPSAPVVSNGGVSVDLSHVTADPENIPEEKEQNVRVRIRTDHKCVIAMERYDFKKGRTYLVPPNVKRILSEAGLLDPL